MILIRLFCAGGASTSLLAEKVRNAARRGLSVELTCGGVHNLEQMEMQELESADVAPLGPQVDSCLSYVDKRCEEAGVSMTVIPMRDYGLCDGKVVLDMALKMYEDNQLKKR